MIKATKRARSFLTKIVIQPKDRWECVKWHKLWLSQA